MEFIATVIGLIIAWLTYRKSFPQKSKESIELDEEKDALLTLFRTTQKTATEVRNGYTEYAEQNGMMEELIFPGITYRHYIDTLAKSHKACLSNSLYKRIKETAISKAEIKIVREQLSQQYNALVLLKNDLMLKQNKPF